MRRLFLSIALFTILCSAQAQERSTWYSPVNGTTEGGLSILNRTGHIPKTLLKRAHDPELRALIEMAQTPLIVTGRMGRNFSARLSGREDAASQEADLIKNEYEIELDELDQIDIGACPDDFQAAWTALLEAQQAENRVLQRASRIDLSTVLLNIDEFNRGIQLHSGDVDQALVDSAMTAARTTKHAAFEVIAIAQAHWKSDLPLSIHDARVWGESEPSIVAFPNQKPEI